MRTASLGRQFWALWLILLVAKAILTCRLPLFGDEAWYWLEGQHPAWAYSDLPGLTAWLARLGAETAGTSEFALRWPFLALGMAVPLLVRASARRCFGSEAGDRAGLLALLLPLLGGLGFLALPDVPLTFAAALCLYAALRLTEGVDTATAAWLGLGLAIGALSHYRFAPLILAGGAGLLLDPGGRRALRDARVWVAILFGALAWVPLLIWNQQHLDAGLQFQLTERHPWALHSEGVWLPLSQLVVVTPFVLFLLLASLVATWRRWRAHESGPWAIVLGAASMPLALYLALAFVADRERVSFHWLLQAWLPLLVVAPTVFTRWSYMARVATQGTAAAGLILLLGYALVAAIPRLRSELADSRWYPDNFAGWHEIAGALRAMPDVESGEIEVVADNFKLGAQLAFALQRPHLPMLDHRLNHKHGRAVQLRIWGQETRLGAPSERPRLLVVEDSAVPERDRNHYYRALCEQAGRLALLREIRIDRDVKRFTLFIVGSDGSRPDVCEIPGDIDRVGAAPTPAA